MIDSRACTAVTLLFALLCAGCGVNAGGRGLQDRDAFERYEAVKAMPASDDVPTLIDMLENEPDEGVAWYAWNRLVERTGVKFGSPRNEKDRREAAAGWREWSKSNDPK